MIPMDVMTGLPGEELVRRGLADLQARRRSIHALLVSIARTRLIRAGLLPESTIAIDDEPERELYRQLLAEGGDAYSRYNALVRELISFELALDQRLRKSRSPTE